MSILERRRYGISKIWCAFYSFLNYLRLNNVVKIPIYFKILVSRILLVKVV